MKEIQIFKRSTEQVFKGNHAVCNSFDGHPGNVSGVAL
ncbi:hypothetical protein ATN83_p10164 (plasmid) [Raoultella ornithinolytica]|nr:hypothetical protein ATN83_p10164 [Raoultella ornithinolytica]